MLFMCLSAARFMLGRQTPGCTLPTAWGRCRLACAEQPDDVLKSVMCPNLWIPVFRALRMSQTPTWAAHLLRPFSEWRRPALGTRHTGPIAKNSTAAPCEWHMQSLPVSTMRACASLSVWGTLLLTRGGEVRGRR